MFISLETWGSYLFTHSSKISKIGWFEPIFWGQFCPISSILKEISKILWFFVNHWWNIFGRFGQEKTCPTQNFYTMRNPGEMIFYPNVEIFKFQCFERDLRGIFAHHAIIFQICNFSFSHLSILLSWKIMIFFNFNDFIGIAIS